MTFIWPPCPLHGCWTTRPQMDQDAPIWLESSLEWWMKMDDRVYTNWVTWLNIRSLWLDNHHQPFDEQPLQWTRNYLYSLWNWWASPSLLCSILQPTRMHSIQSTPPPAQLVDETIKDLHFITHSLVNSFDSSWQWNILWWMDGASCIRKRRHVLRMSLRFLCIYSCHRVLPLVCGQ